MRPGCIFCSDKATSPDALLASFAVSEAQRPGVCSADEMMFSQRLATAVTHLPLRVLKKELTSMGVAAVESCIERSEVELLASSIHVCGSPACRRKLSASCLRPLPCHHFCVGCRGEPACPPCTVCDASSVGGSLCPSCAEPIPPGPAVRLDCGHMVHAECLARQLHVEVPGRPIDGRAASIWRGPEGPLSFDFRRCPACRARIGDLGWPPAVAAALRRASELEAELGSRAAKRLRGDPRHRTDDAIRPGGAFDGRPREYALSLYRYYLCESCSKPYFGGERRCEAAPAQGAHHSAEERRICGGCAATKAGAKCPARHDPSFMEWKCRFCCSVAAWFCWGTTHMCDACHESPNRSAKPCA